MLTAAKRNIMKLGGEELGPELVLVQIHPNFTNVEAALTTAM